MYEAEVNSSVDSIDTLPEEIRQRLAESAKLIEARTVLPWGEHCTECNWPTCYTSCELYTPRRDGACRLFVDGMVRVDDKDTPVGYVLKIRFKHWGKLWTVGNLNLLPVRDAARKERFNILLGAVARSFPLPSALKGKVLRRVSHERRRSAENATPSAEAPNSFLFECYNPNQRAIGITFAAKPRAQTGVAYQRMVRLEPGFTRERIPFQEIGRFVDTRQPFEIEIAPNDCDDTVLYFGILDFVKETARPGARESPSGGKKWKCIVWDLDNTLWDGVLVEDGPDKICIRQGVVDVIKETDRRGILHSIASKNNHDDAIKVLKTCGLEDYFLHPQINWSPKSESIARVAQQLNIGVDSLAFVDDQPFEREEVKAALPRVALVDAAEFASIPGRAECRGPVTGESRLRRQMYREEEQREAILGSYSGDYTKFLRECHIELNVARLSNENVERVYELAQRTNQMNFSGHRYSRTQLAELMQSKSHETHVLSCTDRFGSYGIVGFSLVDLNEGRLLDLVFSCRVRSKRVEYAFLRFILQRFMATRSRDFYANYRRTPNNEPSGKVFSEMGFEQVQEQGGVLSLVFRSGRDVPDDGIIRITERETA